MFAATARLLLCRQTYCTNTTSNFLLCTHYNSTQSASFLNTQNTFPLSKISQKIKRSFDSTGHTHKKAAAKTKQQQTDNCSHKMSNVHGLFSKKKDEDAENDEHDDSNNRYVGGVGDRGGGSGLAVEPNHDEQAAAAARNNPLRAALGGVDAVFGLAENADAGAEPIRRTITMYRDGFVVDDGPYRRLDDPANAEFLSALASGRTPKELVADAGEGGNVAVGLVDKRSEEYVETFQSFSGAGASLGATVSSSDGVFDPSTLPAATEDRDGDDMTSVAVRLLTGKRQVVKISLSATVQELASRVKDGAGGVSFRLASGFPPQPLTNPNQTILDAGLKGAQVAMQKI